MDPQDMALAMALYERYKAVSSTPNPQYAHGPGGLFSNPALSQDVYSAIVAAPYSGIQFVLPVIGTPYTDPLDGIVTGVTANSGSNANGICDDPPTVGLLKLCEQSYPLGRFALQTQVIDISRGTRLQNRGEHTDFQVFGYPSGSRSGQSPFVPSLPGVSLANAANTEIGKRMFEFFVGWSRSFSKLIYSGNPANNTAGGGYKEFNGFDKLINTGYRDAVTGQACAAADSIVKSFANKRVETNAVDIVNTIIETWFALMQNAAMMNMAPVELVMAMPLSLFYRLSEIWPVAYLTTGAAVVPTGSTNFIDSGDAAKMRDDMRGDLQNRTGQYLMIMGQKVPVVVDDAINESGLGSGVQAATIYFIPLRVLGGARTVTYLEYLDYNAVGVPQDAAVMSTVGSFRATDKGRFLVHVKPPTNFCVQLLAVTEPRLKLRTPYLAARIDNVAYLRNGDLRSGFPESPYFKDGGRVDYIGFGPSYYTPTS